MSEFLRKLWSWPGAVYSNSSTLGPLPQRTCWMCSMTAAGSTSSTAPTPENGPNARGDVQPRTSSNHETASATFGTVMPMWSIPSRPGTLVTTGRSVPLGRPERAAGIALVGHPVRVADQLDVRAERRLEVVDCLAGGGALRHGERPGELLGTVCGHVLDGRVDVGHVERDVVAAPVGVLRRVRPLVGCRVVEELDVGAPAAAHHRDLLDDRQGVDVQQVLHARERPERERRDAAHPVLEPGDGLVDVGHGDPDVVHPDEPELAVRVAGGARARIGGRR